MPNANVSLQVIPKTKEDHAYELVDRAIEVIQASGVKYEVGPMETTMEGDLEELLEIAKQAQEASIQAGAAEVISYIKIHYRPEGVTMEEKVGKYR